MMALEHAKQKSLGQRVGSEVGQARTKQKTSLIK